MTAVQNIPVPSKFVRVVRIDSQLYLKINNIEILGRLPVEVTTEK